MSRLRTSVQRALFGTVLLVLVAVAVFWTGCNKDSQSPVDPSASVQQRNVPFTASAQLQSAIATHTRNSDGLLAVRGVVGTAVSATDDGRYALRIYVTDERTRSRLPSEIDGVPVVVETSEPFVAFQSAERGNSSNSISTTAVFPRPVPIGVSTGNQGECSAGTISARLTGNSQVYALSNNHVYALENAAPLNSSVVQPGLYDSNCLFNPQNAIGTLYAYIPVKFDGTNNTVDAAIALTSTSKLATSTPSNGYGIPSSTTVLAFVGQAVEKYGRTTSLTTGKVTGIGATVLVSYSSTKTAKFVNQIIISGKGSFSKAGDSGSLIVTNDGHKHPVGLLFAGSSSITIANPINDVLSAFNGASVVGTKVTNLKIDGGL
jgi:hypothetical protein